MKTYLLKFWNWKHRNELLFFLGGFAIATIIWLSIGNDENLSDTDLEMAKKEGQILELEKSLKDSQKEAKEYKIKDSINVIILNELQLDLNKLKYKRDEKINRVDYYTDAELQEFFSKRYGSSTFESKSSN